ncbi:MAG: NAD(P)-dependent oxidoreductase [Planctomycetota bacterium]
MSWRSSKVLVTGGSGFVGRWLMRRLAAEGADLVNVDRLEPDGAPSGGFIASQLDEPAAFASIIDEVRPQIVIHLAGQAGVATCHKNPVEAYSANVTATMVLLEGIRTARFGGVEAITATSSNHVYGDQDGVSIEASPLNGLGTYAATKACSDVLCRCYAHEYGIPVTVARITNSFGGDDPHATHIVTATVLSCLRGETPIIKGSGRDTKSFMHIEDTVDGILALAERSRTDRGLDGAAFNIVPEVPTTVYELVGRIMRIVGLEGEPVVERPDAHAEIEHLSAAAARDRLGWTSSRTLDQAIEETVAWYRQHETVAA